MEYISKNDDWSFSLEEGIVQLLQIDFRLTLVLSDGESDDSDKAELSINTACVLEHGGAFYFLTPEDPLTLAPALSLVNAEVVSISIQKTGDLKVEFANNALLSIEPDEGYEAWEMDCSIAGDSIKFVCLPGGEVEIFNSEPKALAKRENI